MAIYSRKLSVSISKRVSDISKYLDVLAIDFRKPSSVNKEACFTSVFSSDLLKTSCNRLLIADSR